MKKGKRKDRKDIELLEETLFGGEAVKTCITPVVGVTFECEFGPFSGHKRKTVINEWVGDLDLKPTNDSMFKLENSRKLFLDEKLFKEQRNSYSIEDINYISKWWRNIIRIEHQPQNIFDPNAHVVTVSNSTWSSFSDIGYLPKDLSEKIINNDFEIYILQVLFTQKKALRLGLIFLNRWLVVGTIERKFREKVECNIQELDKVLSI